MLAQRLRHRANVEALVVLRDPVTGAKTEEFVPYLIGEPMEIFPLSGSEFVAAAATQAGVSTRITMRWNPQTKASDRIVHDGAIYDIAAVLPDFTNRKWLTVMCRSGVNDG